MFSARGRLLGNNNIVRLSSSVKRELERIRQYFEINKIIIHVQLRNEQVQSFELRRSQRDVLYGFVS
jgi:hypothetical protein